MEISLDRVTQQEFYKFENVVLFSDQSTDRCFGVITNGTVSYRLAWRSDLIDPVATKISSCLYCVGIDQDFAVVNFCKEKVVLKLKLNYNFFDTYIIGSYVYVITEFEIIKVDKNSFEVLVDYHLPELFEEMVIKEGFLEVKCAESNVLKIPYS